MIGDSKKPLSLTSHFGLSLSALSLVSTLMVGILSWINAESFTRITEGEIVNDGGESYGASWADYDNDGDLDLFVANTWQNNFLYQNNGDGSFIRITSGPVVTDSLTSHDGSWADYDNDGDIDLCVAFSHGENNALYTNNGDGTFTAVVSAPVVTDGGTSTGVSWADMDMDGYVDLFISNYYRESNFLYLNNGDGTFRKVTDGPVVSDRGSSLGSAWGDYDNDGDPDLFVANMFGENNFLYSNNGDGTFTKITSGPVVNDREGSVGGSWGDYDNDGDLDLFVANTYDHNNFLYSNNGDGSFTRIMSGPLVNDGGRSTGSAWGDYDNDGDLDIFVGNFDRNNYLYENNGEGVFSRITTGDIVSDSANSRGAAWSDYDNDGDLDLFVANLENQDNFLYRNNGNSNNWINIKLVGVASNASAIGARVKVKATISDADTWQLSEVASESGRMGENSLNVEFGLGNASTVDSMVIQWPSGIKQVFQNTEVNQFLTIEEYGEQNIVVTPSDTLSFGLSYIGYESEQELRIKNAGTEILKITSISSDADEFVVEQQIADTLVLGAGQFRHIRILFSPQESRRYSSTLDIGSNDSDQPLYRLALKGQGVLAPIMMLSPDSLAETLFSGDTSIKFLTLSNLQTSGGADLVFEALVEDLWDLNQSDPAGRRLNVRTARRTSKGTSQEEAVTPGLRPESSLENLRKRGHSRTTNSRRFQRQRNEKVMEKHESRPDIGAVLDSFPVPGQIGFAWGIGFEPRNKELWISDVDFNAYDHKMTPEGTYVDQVYLNWVSGWAADIATEGGNVYQVHVGGDNRIYRMDLEGNVIDSLSGPWTYSQRGIALDPKTGDLYVGGWNDHGIYRIEGFDSDKPGKLLDFLDFSGTDIEGIAGIAWHSGTKTLWVAANDYYDIIAEVDPMTREVLQLFEFPGSVGYSAAGLDIDPDGDFWVVNQSHQTVYRVEGTPVLRPFMVRPTSGIIPPGQSLNLEVLFDAGGLAEGPYDGRITVVSNDPETDTIRIPVTLTVKGLSVVDNPKIPLEYTLHQNFPNPFNSATTIRYDIPKASQVSLAVYDILGRRVSYLVNELQQAGSHNVQLYTRNQNDSEVAAGVYIYRLVAGDYVKTRKLVVIK